MRVNGLYGWVRRNDARSAVLMAGFALLTQPMAMVVAFMPLVFLDHAHAPWYDWGGYVSRYAPLTALAALAYFLAQMRRHVGAVRLEAGFRPVDRAAEPRLHTLLEPLAIAIGLPLPRLGVIESEALNAFACGVTRGEAVVVVTRGLVDGLDDDELAAVLAHELIHIRNRDIRLVAAANVFMRSMTLLARVDLLRPKRYRQIAALIVLPILIPVVLVNILLVRLFLGFARASRLMISTAREFVADAEAVRLTQDPAALVSALRRIESHCAIPGLPVAQDAMMIAGTATGALATHPPMTARIDALAALTGGMLLDARPRRDTRGEALRRQGASREGRGEAAAWTPNEARRLARIAIRTAVPRPSLAGALLRPDGAGGILDRRRDILGLRWDIAAALMGAIATAAVLNHGDLPGFAGTLGHALDRPNAAKRGLIDQAFACRDAGFAYLLGVSGTQRAADACGATAATFANARAFGIHALNDGRVLDDAQFAMLSPDEIRAVNARPFDPAPLLHRQGAGAAAQPATDLAASYPLPLHEAWQRLNRGRLRRYLERAQCGVLIHADITGERDRSVSWSIRSEGVERIRFTAVLQPVGAAETRVMLSILDSQPTRRVFDADGTDASGRPTRDTVGEPVVFRPAVAPPLRPAFAEAINAMLEERLFSSDRIWNGDAYKPGDGMTAGLCDNQRGRLQRSRERFSIHDPEDAP